MYIKHCTCCKPVKYYITRQSYYHHKHRERINSERKMKRSSIHISNPSNTTTNTVSIDHPVTPVDKSVSISVNQLIKSTTLLVEVNVEPAVIYKKLKGIVSSNKGKSQAIKEFFQEKKESLKESKLLFIV
nr:MAG: hypothetical protein [Lake Baikal virophage 9]